MLAAVEVPKKKLVEVVIIWGDRVLDTYHFVGPGIVKVDFGEIAIPSDLKEDEVLLVQLDHGLKAQIRLVEKESEPIAAPMFDLNQEERERVIATFALSAILALYLFAFPYEEVGRPIELADESPRKVTFIYQKPEPIVELTEILQATKAKPAQSSGLLGSLAEIGRAIEKVSKTSNQVRALGDGASGSATRNDSNSLDGVGTKNSGPGGGGEKTVGLPGGVRKGKIYGTTGPGLGKKSGIGLKVGGAGESFTGTIDREGIRRVVRDHQQEVQACYERALNQSPGLSGKIVMEWEILGHGKVGRVKVLNSSIGNASVAECMTKALKGWTFPEPPVDQIAVVAFPFVFLPLE